MTEIVNPYIAGSPVKGTEMFFGRADVFDFLKTNLSGQYQDNAIVLYGRRRTGKTTVLYQMQRHLGDKYICVFVDLHGLALEGLNGFLWELANHIRRTLRRDHDLNLKSLDRAAFNEDARNQFHLFLENEVWPNTNGHRLLLMLDEAIRLQEQVRAGKLEPEIFEYLRHLMQHYRRLNFVFSLGSGLEEMKKEYALLFNTALYKKISFLDRESAKTLITQPAIEYYQVEPTAVNYILNITSCHPYYTQLICHSLFNQWQNNKISPISIKDVDTTLDEVVERGLAVLKWVWEESTPAEQAVIAGLAASMGDKNKPVSKSQIKRAWSRLKVSIPSGELARALQLLISREVIEGDNAYQFTIDIQHLWVRKYKRLEWVKEELSEIIPQWKEIEDFSRVDEIRQFVFSWQGVFTILAVVISLILLIGLISTRSNGDGNDQVMALTSTAYARTIREFELTVTNARSPIEVAIALEAQANAEATIEALVNGTPTPTSGPETTGSTATPRRVSSSSEALQAGMNINPDAPFSNPMESGELAGLDWVRWNFSLDARELVSERGDIEAAFDQYDPIVQGYVDQGVSSIIVLDQGTVWGNAPWSGNNDWETYAELFAEQAGLIAANYASYGDQVAYEIWNEGDLPNNPSSIFIPPEDYAIILEEAVKAIRNESPDSPILFGGLATGPSQGIPYLQSVEEALGGELPVDGIGIHPYGRWGTVAPFDWGNIFGTLGQAFDQYEAAFPDIPIWITEIGVAADNEVGPEYYSDIALYMKDVYCHVDQEYVDQVPVVVWYAWSDLMRNAGIVDSSGTPKDDVYEAFEDVREGRPFWCSIEETVVEESEETSNDTSYEGEFKFEAWPTEYKTINQYFGANPQNYAQFGLPGHEGVDIQAPSGSKVFAVAQGVVSTVRTDPTGHNYGIHIRIDHIDGFQTLYAQLQQADVEVGDSVSAGELIGLSNNTGNSFGSHLHFGLYREGYTYQNWPLNIFDPTPFLFALLEENQEESSVSGWAFNGSLELDNSSDKAQVALYGVNLRVEPNRAAMNLGFIPSGKTVIITGESIGEYTPILVAEGDIVNYNPVQTIQTSISDFGSSARIGLHASADPNMSEDDFQAFTEARTQIIKVMSFHNSEDVSRLATEHPNASFIVRAFLDIGGRSLTPEQYFVDTVGDVQRVLKAIGEDRNVVVEIHNEPNLTFEGFGSSWEDGTEFADWWLEVLALYHQEMPDTQFIYPGLSPGATVSGIKVDHIEFLEASREAVEAADGLGIHLYWSNVASMEDALNILDDYIARFPNKAIWITEASNNREATDIDKADQYLFFWHELQRRPTVKGVTYFVASAEYDLYSSQVWVGTQIPEIIGNR